MLLKEQKKIMANLDRCRRKMSHRILEIQHLIT